MTQAEEDTITGYRIDCRIGGEFLIIDDDEDCARYICMLLRKRIAESDVMVAKSYREAMRVIDITDMTIVRCAMIDLHLPDGDGIDIIKVLDTQHPEVPIVAYTNDTDMAAKCRQEFPRVTAILKGDTQRLVRVFGLPRESA